MFRLHWMFLLAACAAAILNAQPAPAERPVSWRRLVPNIFSDQKKIWLFPLKLARGQDWIPTAVVLGSMAGLQAVDPHEASYFRGSSSWGGFNRVFSSRGTQYGIEAAPVTLYVAGMIRKDSKMQRTALFSAEAILDSEILTRVLKDTTNRLRPVQIPPGGDFGDSWFEQGPPHWRQQGSFPSGHEIAAFAVATIVARRYGNHRWVPYVAYSTAALIGFSRLTLSAHFASDVFMGGALGYSISRFAVLRQ